MPGKLFVIASLVVIVTMLAATVTSAITPKFKEQDLDEALAVREDPDGCDPEIVPIMDEDGDYNIALLEDAEPNADSLIDGWCPKRHCTEYLNDGFYNNCRSWITGDKIAGEAWAEIDLGAVYPIRKVGFGSDHCGKLQDRCGNDFMILVATEYDVKSEAASWEVVYDNKKGVFPRQTTYFNFSEEKARYVRISILGSPGVRIDEIEIYCRPGALGVTNGENRLAACWGEIKVLY